MEKEYPKWYRFEGLEDSYDKRFARMPEENFWNLIVQGAIPFPKLGDRGYWLAVEDLPKPNIHNLSPVDFPDEAKRLPYKTTRISDIFKCYGRFGNSHNWRSINDLIKVKREEILTDIGLSCAEMRMLRILEWNLLGNRLGWGFTDAFEWTDTAVYKKINTGECSIIPYITGGRGFGGAGSVLAYPEYGWWRHYLRYPKDDEIGFRLAIDIEGVIKQSAFEMQ